MLPSCLLTPRSEPGRTLHSTGLYLSSRINLSFKQCREMKKKKWFHLANIDRKLSFLFFAGLHSPKAQFLREEIIYPQNLLNKMKAERNSGASPKPEMGMGLGQSGDPRHCSATSLLCIMAAPLQRGASVPPLSESAQGSQRGDPARLLPFIMSGPRRCKAVAPHQLPAQNC